MRRTVVLTGKQRVGLPALALLPVLALCGILGPNRAAIVGSFATSALSFVSPRLKGLVASSPSVLVEHGTLVEREMRRERIAPEKIQAALRQNGLERLDQVKSAVLESDGSISVIREG